MLKDVIENKLIDIQSEIDSLQNGAPVVMIVGGSGGGMTQQEMLDFQQFRLDTLQGLEELDRTEILASAQTVMQELLANPTVELRASLDLHMLAAGATSLDELLLMFIGEAV